MITHICMQCIRDGKPAAFEDNSNGRTENGEPRPQCPQCLEEIDIESADDLDVEDIEPDDFDFYDFDEESDEDGEIE